MALILRVLDEKSDFLSNSEFTHNESKAHIKENYEFIKSWFETRKNKKQLFAQNLCEKVEFIYVKAPTLDDAFIFFDSANAKGKRLEGYDLIKAFHLRALEDTEPFQKHKEKLRAKDINPDDKDALIEHYAKYFEKFAKQDDNKNKKDKKDIEILFNETLAPARRWIRYNSNEIPSEMDIYAEFCVDIPQRLKTQPLIAKDSLGILQNFIGGVDFFEYLQDFKEIYDNEIKNNNFFEKLKNIREGVRYNCYMYIMAMLIYFDKFCDSSNKEYVVRLIARAVFSVRVEKSKIDEKAVKKYAIDEKLLSLIYFTSYEKELENELKKFIDNRKDKESGNNKRTNATEKYLQIVKTEYECYDITPHPKSKDKGANNE